MKTNKAIAYHEAGHAFADWHFKFKVKKATIVPKDDAAGYVTSKTGLHFRSLEYTNPSGARIGHLHERIVSIMAGHAAQRRYRPSSVRSCHGSDDRQKAFDLLTRLHSPKELPHVWRYLEAKAKNLIENPMHWRVIQHLAESLLENQTMTGAQVEAAIREGFDRDFQERIRARDRTQVSARTMRQSGSMTMTWPARRAALAL
jgi:ATP-dependent Zn protease